MPHCLVPPGNKCRHVQPKQLLSSREIDRPSDCCAHAALNLLSGERTWSPSLSACTFIHACAAHLPRSYREISRPAEQNAQTTTKPTNPRTQAQQNSDVRICGGPSLHRVSAGSRQQPFGPWAVGPTRSLGTHARLYFLYIPGNLFAVIKYYFFTVMCWLWYCFFSVFLELRPAPTYICMSRWLCTCTDMHGDMVTQAFFCRQSAVVQAYIYIRM